MGELFALISPQVAQRELPDVRTGDTVRVNVSIIEGDRERIQPFQGLVIRKRQTGAGPAITVRRIAAHGIGVERTFPLYSPRIAGIEILHRAKTRRKQLYFLRDRVGKKAALR